MPNPDPAALIRPRPRAGARRARPSTVNPAVAFIAIGSFGLTGLASVTVADRVGGVVPTAVVSAPLAAAPAAAPARGDVVEHAPVVLAAKPSAAAKQPAHVAATHATPRRTAPVRQRAAARWLPTGTGMWIYQVNRSNGGRPAAIVARAKAVGLTHIFVRTGSTHDGWTGAATLRALLPAATRANLQVVAWDFPELTHPLADAKRLARAARFVLRGGARVAAVAPDIETPSEGTASTAKRVRTYLVALRKLLPAQVPILATVPWPSSSRVGRFPYAIVASHSDALLPMAYWYNNSPIAVTTASVHYLRRFHKPILPVGQGYDGHIDVSWLPHSNLRAQVPAFFVTARKLGLQSASLWSWQSAPRVTWDALRAARGFFPAR